MKHAKDDAAGAVISSKTNLKISGLKLAKNNIQLGLSLLDTANYAYSNISNILTRIRDLSLEASNGTCDQSSRNAIQNEIDALTDELEKIKKTTTFNDINLFNNQPSTETKVDNTPPDTGQIISNDDEETIPMMMSMRSSPIMLANTDENEGIALTSLDDGANPIAENISGSVDFAAGETKTIIIDGVSYTATNRNSFASSISYSKNSETGEITLSCSTFTIKGQDNVSHKYIINGKSNYVYGANLDDSFASYDQYSNSNKLYGEGGNDTFNIQHNSNDLYGGDGDDTFIVKSYSDMYGNAGNDKFYISGGSNNAYGGDGDDYFELNGSTINKLYGEGDEDEFNIIKATNAIVDGGEGTNKITDTATGTESINVPGATSYSVEFKKNETKVITIQGKEYTVKNRTSSAATFLYSIEDNGAIKFTSPSFTIQGQLDVSHNVVIAGTGIYFYGGNEADTIVNNSTGMVYALGGDDDITLVGNSSCWAGEGNDTILLKSNYMIVYGEEGDDTVTYNGNYKYQYIDLGEGNDTLNTKSKTIVGASILGAEDINTITGSTTKFTDVYTQGFDDSENTQYLRLEKGETREVEINGIKYTIKNNQADNENSISWKYDPIEDKITFSGANVKITGQSDVAHNVELYGRTVYFYGGNEADNIKSMGGYSHYIYGNGGNDNIIGGNSIHGVNIYGGEGDDIIEGNGTSGKYYGEAGNDTFTISNSVSALDGGEGDDNYYINYTAVSSDNYGNNVYYLNANNINLTAGSGHDTFYVQGDSNTVNGGAGDDYFVVSGNNNLIQGGTGTNYIVNNGENPDIQDVVIDPNSGAFVFTQANEVKLVQVDDKIYTITNINANNSSILNHEVSYTYNKNTGEIIFTGSNVTIDCNDEAIHNIRLEGNNNVINGSKNADTILISSGSGNFINSKAGDDHITMDSENNSINTGNGEDTIILNASTNLSVNAGSGNDNLQINSDNNTNIKLGSGSDTVSGTTSGSYIDLSSNNNNLLLNGSNNTIEALDGDNRISFIGDNNNVTAEDGNNSIGFKGDSNSAILSGNAIFNIEGNLNELEAEGTASLTVAGNSNTAEITGNTDANIRGDNNEINTDAEGIFNVKGNDNILNSASNASYKLVGDNNTLSGQATANFNVQGSNNTLTSSDSSNYELEGDLNTLIVMSGVCNGSIAGNNNNLNLSADSSKIEIKGNENSYENSLGSDTITLKGSSNSLTLGALKGNIEIEGNSNNVSSEEGGMDVKIDGDENQVTDNQGDASFVVNSGAFNIVNGGSGTNTIINYGEHTNYLNATDVTPRPLILDLQVGAEGNETINIEVGFELAGFKINVDTQENALKSVEKIDKLLDKVTSSMAMVGAKINRLESIYDTTEMSIEKLTCANSLIVDADIAQEMIENVQAKIWQQISVSLLSQANNKDKNYVQKLLGLTVS